MNKTHRNMIVAFIVFLILSIGMAFVFWPKDNSATPRINIPEPAASQVEKTLPDNPIWQAQTHPYTASCKELENCIPLGASRAGHGGPAVIIGYDKTLDDAVAQWGDCVQSVMSCRQTSTEWSVCVQNSVCPVSCKAEFDSKSQDILGNKQKPVFETIFINEGGYCVPEENR